MKTLITFFFYPIKTFLTELLTNILEHSLT